MNKTKIEWCYYTWNPIVGCSPASTGCEHCYAAEISKRFGLPWGSAHFMPERLAQPKMMRKPGRVFVCSMSDLGHRTVTHDMRLSIYAAMRDAPQHTYIILTKRPGPWLRELPPSCWVGVTVENQSMADERIPILLEYTCPIAIRFVSAEPLLQKINLTPSNNVGISWVIAGPETGPGARPCKQEWIDQLSAESPCFFDKSKVWTRREFPKQI